jgi:hypothetical protein
MPLSGLILKPTIRGVQVCRIANFLKSEGVKAGDTVSIYLPMITELPAAMLACARIGTPSLPLVLHPWCRDLVLHISLSKDDVGLFRVTFPSSFCLWNTVCHMSSVKSRPPCNDLLLNSS